MNKSTIFSFTFGFTSNRGDYVKTLHAKSFTDALNQFRDRIDSKHNYSSTITSCKREHTGLKLVNG